jgi:translation elongation factor EF-Ts
MIKREEIKNLASIEKIDDQIKKRQDLLNSMSKSVYPQILSEEIVQLRIRRFQVEEDLSNQLAEKTGWDRMDCHIALIRSNWDLTKAEENLNEPRSDDPSSSESIQRIVDSQQER